MLHGDDYFAPVGGLPAQMFKSSIEGGAESMQLMYLLSLAAAKSTIDISMAYFMPDDLTMDHIVAALKRGVRVRVILPGDQNDSLLVRAASRSKYGRILRAGGEIHEYQPTMFHCKVLVVDGRWVSVGSTNFDSRSFRLNDEANLNVYEESFAKRSSRSSSRTSARRVASRCTNGRRARYGRRRWTTPSPSSARSCSGNDRRIARSLSA